MWPFQSSDNNPSSSDQNSNNQQAPEPQPEGLDKFAFLVDNASNKGDTDNQDSKPKRTDVGELFKNPEFTKSLRTNLRQTVNSSISPETRQKIESGDTSALMELVSEVSEASYLQALQHSASLQNLVLNERIEDVHSNTSELVDTKLQNQEFTQAIPQLKNPIVKLGVEAFMSKVKEQNPSITPEEMKSQITEYVSELGKDLGATPAAEPEPTDDVDKGVDWLAELGIENPPSSEA